ncbi:hypothetical protein [Humibacter sp.]|uniref:hypothetical protein n=1 Tax=Humibacter sp. TaxID=1940291 RepID=UPI003F7F15F5
MHESNLGRRGRDRNVTSGPDVQCVEVASGASIEVPQCQRSAADEPDARHFPGTPKLGDEVAQTRDDVISVEGG